MLNPVLWEAITKYGAVTVIAIGVLWFVMKILDRLIKDKMVQSDKASTSLDTMTKNFLGALERIVNDYKVAMLDNTKALQCLNDSNMRSQEQHAMHQKTIGDQYSSIDKSTEKHADLCAGAFSGQSSTLTSMDRRLEALEKK